MVTTPRSSFVEQHRDRRRAIALYAAALLSTAALLVLVLGFGLWDEARSAADAFQDLARAQSLLASVIAGELRREVSAGDAHPLTRFTPVVQCLRDGETLVFVQRPDDEVWRSLRGASVRAPTLTRAAERGALWAMLSHNEAVALGLPPRSAAAGLATVDVEFSGRWHVAVVVSAARERDREAHARERLVVGVGATAGLVLALGTVMVLLTRKELALERARRLAEQGRTRDEQLARDSRVAVVVALAAGVAHEVSTPLGVIAGRAEQLLEQERDPERTRRALTSILEQTERIRGVIRGLLDLARGDAPPMERVDPTAVARAALALVAHRYQAASVALELDTPDALDPVAGDPRLLEHALVNLLLNACDASPPGARVMVTLRARGGAVEFVVIDQGDGIPPDAAERVLEPFFTTKPRGKGSGLGLAIAKEIAQIHRGGLRLEPDSPHGTRATIWIPTRREPLDEGA